MNPDVVSSQRSTVSSVGRVSDDGVPDMIEWGRKLAMYTLVGCPETIVSNVQPEARRNSEPPAVGDRGALIITRHGLVTVAPGNEKCRHGGRFLTY